MSGNDTSALLDTPISVAVNDHSNHQNDKTHQQLSGILEHVSGEHRSMSPLGGDSMLGSFPAAVATQAHCSKMVKDFCSSKISQGAALSQIHTTFVNALPKDLPAVEDGFA